MTILPLVKKILKGKPSETPANSSRVESTVIEFKYNVGSDSTC